MEPVVTSEHTHRVKTRNCALLSTRIIDATSRIGGNVTREMIRGAVVIDLTAISLQRK